MERIISPKMLRKYSAKNSFALLTTPIRRDPTTKEISDENWSPREFKLHKSIDQLNGTSQEQRYDSFSDFAEVGWSSVKEFVDWETETEICSLQR